MQRQRKAAGSKVGRRGLDASFGKQRAQSNRRNANPAPAEEASKFLQRPNRALFSGVLTAAQNRTRFLERSTFKVSEHDQVSVPFRQAAEPLVQHRSDLRP